jgi:hypothetical protein
MKKFVVKKILMIVCCMISVFMAASCGFSVSEKVKKQTDYLVE